MMKQCPNCDGDADLCECEALGLDDRQCCAECGMLELCDEAGLCLACREEVGI